MLIREVRLLLPIMLLLSPALAGGDEPAQALASAGEYQTPAMSVADLRGHENGPDAPLVVDVRPSAEYKSGHIEGAVNMPYNKIDKHLQELSEAKAVVLYCTLGHRTRVAEQVLLDGDVPNVYHLEGGLFAWQQAGYPIHTGWGP